MLPGDRLICAFVKQVAVGERFNKWLLHVTIVPWFRLEESSEQITQGLVKSLSAIQPFEAEVEEEVRFGPKKNRPAHLLESREFSAIEEKVRSYLHKKRAWIVDETTKRERPFRPHVTFQGDEHLRTGDTISCDKLYIVEQKGGHKEVVTEIGFGEKKA
jgi:2'-5' RNA ligase